jgi:hypothetical protein
MIENVVTTLRKNGIATSFVQKNSSGLINNFLISTVKDGESFNTVVKEIGFGKPILKPFPIFSPTPQYAVIFHIASVRMCISEESMYWSESSLSHNHPNTLIELFANESYASETHLNLMNDYTINFLLSADVNYTKTKSGFFSKLFS